MVEDSLKFEIEGSKQIRESTEAEESAISEGRVDAKGGDSPKAENTGMAERDEIGMTGVKRKALKQEVNQGEDFNGMSEEKPDVAMNDRKSSDASRKRPKQQWSAQEDEALMLAVLADKGKREEDRSESDESEEEEEEDWDDIAGSVPGKTPVQCLRRYMRYLNKKGGSRESEGSPGGRANIPGETDDAKVSLQNFSCSYALTH